MPKIHTEWGLKGVEALRSRVSVFVIVDVLSFSTAVDVAVSRGAQIIPFPFGDDERAQSAAQKAGAYCAGPRASVAQFSLSPATMTRLNPGDQLLLPSPNGSTLSLAGGAVPVLAGCFRNAIAVARKAHEIAQGGDIGIIPAGERWPDDSLRPAIEDLIGAGSIIDALELPISAEARVAKDAFRAALTNLPNLIRLSVSGQELIQRGFPEDVEIALELNGSAAVPLLREGCFSNANRLS